MKLEFKHEIEKSDKNLPDTILQLILKDRKVHDPGSFLVPVSPLKISLFDFSKAYAESFRKTAALLEEIRKNKRMVVVYTDYDADGITGGAILWETLYLSGFNVMPYVPDRKKEGYGFSVFGIDSVIKQFNPALIISVDHGITKVKEIAYAKKKGVPVVITDHHLKSDEIPKAFAIFHIPLLSGSGVSYFFSKEIFNHFKKNLKPAESSRLGGYFESDYLALAATGTIADLVPLTGPSRSVVKFGLAAYPTVKRYGLKHLLKQAGIDGKIITPYEVGFMIAPRINAIGRLRHAIEALRLLCTQSEQKAYELSRMIGDINTKRQDLVESSVKEAVTMIEKKWKKEIPKVLILVSEDWNEGIIGLIASKMVEKYFRPTIVLTKNDGFYKGSARSIPAFHMTEFLRSLKKHLVDVGGHAQAAGFTIEKDKLSGFEKAALKKAEKLILEKDLEKVIVADIKLPVSFINRQVIKTLEKLEPFGIGNPKPVFMSEVELVSAAYLGKTHKHLKMTVRDAGGNGFPFEMISFNTSSRFTELSRGKIFTVIYVAEMDYWGGREKIKGKIMHF